MCGLVRPTSPIGQSGEGQYRPNLSLVSLVWKWICLADLSGYVVFVRVSQAALRYSDDQNGEKT